MALSFKMLNNDTSQDWVSTYSALNSFVLLPPGISGERFSHALASFAKKHIPADYSAKQEYVLQPLSEMHFDKRFGTYNRSGTFSKDLITAISLIGLFLLVIACINFINLATAQAVNRAREVGVRKALGGRKPQLVVQFLSKSFIITLAAAVVALLAAFAVLPVLNQLLETKVALHFDATIGKNISFWGGQLKGQVVGVVKDFNGNSLARPMAPIVMTTWKGIYENMAV